MLGGRRGPGELQSSSASRRPSASRYSDLAVLNYDKKRECVRFFNSGYHTRYHTKYVSKVIYGIRNFRICTLIMIISFCRKNSSDFRTCSILACLIGCLGLNVRFSALNGRRTSTECLACTSEPWQDIIYSLKVLQALYNHSSRPMISSALCYRCSSGQHIFHVTSLWPVKKQFGRKTARQAILMTKMPKHWSEQYADMVYRMGSPFSMETAFRQLRAMWQEKIELRSSFCNTGPRWSLAKADDCTRFWGTCWRQTMPYQASIVHARRSLGKMTPLRHTKSDYPTETVNWASQNWACTKAQSNFSAKRDNDHSREDSEIPYTVDFFRYLLRVKASMLPTVTKVRTFVVFVVVVQ